MKIWNWKYEDKWASISIWLIPLFTWLYGTKESPLYYTLSMIGNRFDARLEFIVWGVFSASVLFFYVLHLFRLGGFSNPKARRLLIYSSVFLVLCVVTPAIEELWPILHKLHAVFGALFGLTLVLAINYFIKYIKAFNKELYSIAFALLMLSAFGTIVLLLALGNTGIYEFYFFFTISILLILMERKLK